MNINELLAARRVINDRIRGHISAYRNGEQDKEYTKKCIQYFRDAYFGSPQIFFWSLERVRNGLN